MTEHGVRHLLPGRPMTSLPPTCVGRRARRQPANTAARSTRSARAPLHTPQDRKDHTHDRHR